MREFSLTILQSFRKVKVGKAVSVIDFLGQNILN